MYFACTTQVNDYDALYTSPGDDLRLSSPLWLFSILLRRETVRVWFDRTAMSKTEWAAAAACKPSWLWACICVYLTPSLPSAPCIVIRTGKARVYEPDDYTTAGPGFFMVAASHPTPTRRQFYYSDFARWQSAQIETRRADRQYQVPNTHVSTEGGTQKSTAHTVIFSADVRTGAAIKRDVINMRTDSNAEDDVCWHHYA